MILKIYDFIQILLMKALYKHESMDYEELKNTLSNIKGKIILSMNDGANIRNLFKQFKMKGVLVEPHTGRNPDGRKSMGTALLLQHGRNQLY